MKSIYYKFIISAFFLLYSFSGISQTQTAESWTLSTPQSGTKEYVARESISLKPRFSYTASSGNTFTAKIDQTLLFPPTGNTYADENGNIVDSSFQGAVVGSLSGVFDVSPTGAATYSVPIEVPPGIQGMQPNISLVYNSQSGDGMAGMCWNISGLSMISRVPKDYYFDSDRSGIIWDKNSPLALDGQRLIIVNNGWGSDSIEYRTESGIDIIRGYSIGSSGPKYFKIYTKDGRILIYGDVSGYSNKDRPCVYSFFENSITTVGLGTFTLLDSRDLGWWLYEVIDNNSNYIKYTYSKTKWKSGSSNVESYYGDNQVSKIEFGNGNAKVASVLFQYRNKSSSFVQYIDSIETKNQLILEKIEIKGLNDELQDTYQLTYSTLDQKDCLTQIKRTNASGEYIQPVKFDWYTMSYTYNYYKTLTFNPTPNFSSYVNFSPHSYGDIDGDGLVDILVRTSTSVTGGTNSWIVYRNLGNNSFQKMYEESWDRDNENTFLFLDLDNDGKEELYIGRVKQSGTTYTYYLNCYKYTTNSFQAYPSGDMSVATTKAVYDKRGSLYALPGNFLGNGTSQVIIFSSNNTPEFVVGFPANTSVPFGNSSKSKIFLTDLNGNGKPEVAFVNDGTTAFFEYQNSSFVKILSTTQFKYTDYIQVGDFNGDGHSDLLVLNRNSPLKWKIFTSNGKGFIEKDMSAYIPIDVPYTNALVVDVNGDGKSDILTEIPNWVNGSASTSTLKIILSNGDSFSTQILGTITGPIMGESFGIASQFRSGHSKDVFIPFNKNPQIMSLSSNVWFNKINKITDSNGKELTVSYKDYKNPYSNYQNTSDTYDGGQSVLNCFLPNVEVVNSITVPDLNQSYVFGNPQIHRQSKGFLGFSLIKTIDNIHSDTIKVENKLDDTYHFLYPYKNTVKAKGGTLISENYQTYAVSSAGTKRYWLKQDSLISKDALKGITIRTSYSSYDSDRNPQTIKTDYGNGITSTQALTYIKKGSLFFNRLSSNQVTQQATGQSNVVRKGYFFYDNKGNIIQHTKDSISSTNFDVNKVRISYSNYDSYGNPQKITTTANGISRSKSMTYCSYGRFLKTETDNQLNQTITYNYDESKGLLTSKIDRIGTTSYQYDSFGRLKLTTYPDGIKTSNALQWAGTISGKPANAKYYSYTETSGQSPVWVWYDNLGREIRKDAYGLNNKKISTDTEYYTTGANNGRLYRVSEPYFTDDPGIKSWTTHSYDSYGRPSSISTPMGTTNYTYLGLADSITSPSGTRKTTINSAGWVVKEKTNGKTVNFEHYANGLVKKATPEDGQAISMAYDLQGNRTKLTDPSAGVITSKYDGWGQLMQEKQKINITADSILTTYNYLSSGLLKSKIRNVETTNYGYDNLYRLKWISIAGKHAQGFVYDQYDRMTQSNDTIDGSKVFIRKTEYDQLGRVYRETYPDDYSITNQYDKYSSLTGVTGRNSIWKALEENERGQLTKSSQGGRETDFKYDSRGFPTSIVATGINQWSYVFNNKGNLVSRKDDIANYKDSLTYDAMNRLTSWNIYQGTTLTQSNSMTYNPTTGTITTKSGVGYTMNYGENSKPPHALTSISGVPSGLPTDNLTVTYTDFKKISTLTQGNKAYTLSYGVDGERKKSIYKLNNVTQETRYYLGDYEEMTDAAGITKKIHYLSGGAILVATGNTETMYYGYYDHLGSLTALANEQGQVMERYAYDPWGNRRNPTNWTQSDSRTSWLVNRGYTMHEHLDAFGIINMNGRVYDPLTAQFFSPDPYLQAPGDWLNYNRYSYAMNNPLLYTDPSGEFLGIAFRALSFFGGSLSNWINGYSDPIGSAWKSSGRLANEFSNCTQIPIYQNGNTRISAGLDPFGLGVSANVVHKSGNLTTSSSFGFGLLSGPYANVGASYSAGGLNFSAGAGVGNNYWGWNASATYGGYGLGYGQTHFGNATGPDGLPNSQILGNATLFLNKASITLQNDVNFKGFGGDGHDRWRTNALELTFGDFSIGSYIYTNDGKVASEWADSQYPTYDGVSPLWGKNNNGPKYTAWKNGRVYSSPVWFGMRTGSRVERIGYSFRRAQDAQQNFIHSRTTFGNQNYYLHYGDFRAGVYLHTGYYNSFSLYSGFIAN